MSDHPQHQHFSHTRWIQLITAIVLLLLCLSAVWWFYRGARQYYRHEHHVFIQTHTPLAPADIQPWMTFNYINRVFKLPADYLKNNLNITDPRYPNISINRFATMNHQNPQTVVNQVQSSIKNYQVSP